MIRKYGCKYLQPGFAAENGSFGAGVFFREHLFFYVFFWAKEYRETTEITAPIPPEKNTVKLRKGFAKNTVKLRKFLSVKFPFNMSYLQKNTVKLRKKSRELRPKNTVKLRKSPEYRETTEKMAKNTVKLRKEYRETTEGFCKEYRETTEGIP